MGISPQHRLSIYCWGGKNAPRRSFNITLNKHSSSNKIWPVFKVTACVLKMYFLAGMTRVKVIEGACVYFLIIFNVAENLQRFRLLHF